MALLWDVKWTLLSATIVTAKIFVLSAILAVILSLIFGLAAISRFRIIRYASLTYGEIFRGVSLVVQLFWLYFVLPLFGVTLSATTASVLGVGLCFGAYGAEVVRASLLSIADGQRQAAAALGFPPYLSLSLIEIPQALKIMLPPMANLLVLILKSTSVTALITVPELSFTASALNANLGASVAVFAYVMFAYYMMAKIILIIMRRFESRLERTNTLRGDQA